MDNILATIANCNKKLTTLNCYKTGSITEVGATHFSGFANLEELNLGRCFVSDAKICIQALALGCLNLKKLNLSRWDNLENDSLSPGICELENITDLNVSHSKVITEYFCEKTLKFLPKLQKLDISGCNIPTSQVSCIKYPIIS